MSIFYDPGQMLSYNALFNFIVGSRGVGKTYGMKKYAVTDFMKSGGQFGWVRRYEREMKNVKTFWKDLITNGEFPEHELTVNDGLTFQIDGQQAGQGFILSTTVSLKGDPFPEINKIIFDEFLIDRGTYHYLPDEVLNFLNLYESVARLRNVRVFFLSNAISVTNPYFLYFDLELPKSRNKIWRKGDLLVQLAESQAYIEAKNQSRFGQLIQGTTFADHAINNEFFRDSDVFICRKTQQSRFLFGMTFNGFSMGVWVDYQAGRITVSQDIDPSTPLMYSVTRDDHSPNMILIQSLSSNPAFKMFLQAYEQGSVYFESMNIKNICYQVFKLFHFR